MAVQPRARAGWSLFEVAVLVAVLAVVGVIAVEQISNHLDRAKTREAVDNVDHLVRASALYISTAKVDTNGSPLACQFPGTAPLTPAPTCCSEGRRWCASAPTPWNHPTWRALDFAQTERHRYVYRYTSSGLVDKASFSASASRR